MPNLESNLLYTAAQQRNRGERELRGERRGTGERSSIYRRPLCLFMMRSLSSAALAAILLGSLNPVAAQEQASRKKAVQLRVGVMFFSPLVEDGVRSDSVANSIPAEQSDLITIRQQTAPVITLTGLLQLSERTDLEVGASFATSALQGEDGFETWDAGTVAVGNLMIGVAHAYRPSVLLHGGMGVTKLFSEAEGLFANGSGIHPLLEAGLSWRLPGLRALQLDGRAQLHTFATETLRDEAGQSGNVLRITAGGSYTLGRSAR